MIPASLGLLTARVPTILSPFPAMTVLPAFFLSPVGAVAVPPLLFFAWNPGLLRGEGKIPKRSFVLLVATAIFSFIWFVVDWKNGLHYQGEGYVYTVLAVNVAWITLLGIAFARYWKRDSSFSVSLVLHWVLFAWLAWYAFPYLGELP